MQEPSVRPRGVSCLRESLVEKEKSHTIISLVNVVAPWVMVELERLLFFGMRNR